MPWPFRVVAGAHFKLTTNMKIPTIVGFGLCTLTNKELLEKISNHMTELYEVGSIPTRHIPARPNEDFDLLIGELMVRYHRVAIEDTETEEILKELEADNTDWIEKMSQG